MKIETDAELEKLYQALLTDIETIQRAERLRGYHCFTEKAREKIKILDTLLSLFAYDRTIKEFYEELQNMLAMSDDKRSKRMIHYIQRKIHGS